MTITIKATTNVNTTTWDFRGQTRQSSLAAPSEPATLEAREGFAADLLPMEPPKPLPNKAQINLNGILFDMNPLGVWGIIGYNGRALTYAAWVGEMIS